MSLTVTGRCSKVEVLENRPDLVVVGVSAGVQSWSFNCAPPAVTLDGKPAARPSDVSRFVEDRHVHAVVTGIDWAHAAGFVPCEAIALTTND